MNDNSLSDSFFIDIGTINRLEGRLPQIAISEVEVGLRSTSQIGGPSDLR